MIVFAVRHADRKPEPLDDLTEKGAARARLLARMLGESGVTTAICSSAKRTQLTAQPLKDLLGNRLTVTKVPTVSPTHEDDIVAALKALPQDAVALVVGHSDSVPKIVGKLTGTALPVIGANEFDRLYVVSVHAGGGSTFALARYGEPT